MEPEGTDRAVMEEMDKDMEEEVREVAMVVV